MWLEEVLVTEIVEVPTMSVTFTPAAVVLLDVIMRVVIHAIFLVALADEG